MKIHDDETGASMVEYALLISLIAAVSVAIVQAIGGIIATFFKAGNALNP
jgi:Flp pilus assembly pilin Flp